MLLAALSLPAHAAAVQDRCRTPELLLARRAGVMSPAPYRPDAVGYVDHEELPLRFHYRQEADAERAAALLEVTAGCWRAQIDDMGWPAPPTDQGLGGDNRYDLYLTNEDTYGGAYTWGTGNDTTEGDGYYSLSSFIALDDRAIDDASMPDFLCHEFNHALQYTIDGWEATIFPWEMTAQAMEELNLPESNLYAIDIVDFQELPFMSLLFDGYSAEVKAYDDWSYYEYGGSLAGLFLEERYGARDGKTLLRLWEAMAADEGADEPDFVDGLATLDTDAGAVYLELAAWRMFTGPLDDGAHFYEGDIYAANTVVGQEDGLRLNGIDGTPITPVDPPYDLGTTYWKVELPDGTNDVLHLEVTGSDTVEWGIVAAAWQDGAPARVVTARGGEVGATVSLDLDLSGGTMAMFGVAALGPHDLDAEGRHPRREFTVTPTVLPAAGDSGDTGGTDSQPGDTQGGDDTGKNPETDGKACGCGPGAPVGLWALLAALAVRRR